MVVLCGCSTWLISSSWAQWALDKMAPNWFTGTSARKADGIVKFLRQVESFWHWKTCTAFLAVSHSPTHSVCPTCHIHFQTYVLPEHLVSMIAGNGLGAELISGCGLLCALSQALHGCFVWVFNMPDFILLGSMGIGRDGTQLGFRDSC